MQNTLTFNGGGGGKDGMEYQEHVDEEDLNVERGYDQ